MCSFRYSGAIQIFKIIGSVTKLQKAIGHFSLSVSLIYLTGLGIAELNEEMPTIWVFYKNGCQIKLEQ